MTGFTDKMLLLLVVDVVVGAVDVGVDVDGVDGGNGT